MSRSRTVLIAALLLGALAALFNPGTARAAEYQYGPWYGSGSDDVRAYQADVEPFNSKNTSEIVDFACVTQSGHPIGEEETEIISEIIRNARDIYNGDLKITENSRSVLGGPTLGGDEEVKWGEEGRQAMQAFLRQEKRLLARGTWAPMENREISTDGGLLGGTNSNLEGYSYEAPPGKITINEDEYVDRTVARQVAPLIATDPKHPLELTKGLPEGCNLNIFDDAVDTNLGDLFVDPDQFFLGTILNGTAQLTQGYYSFIQPHAYRYTFWTPHTERGDQMWNVPLTCSPNALQDSGERYTARSAVGDACQGSTPLGYSKSKRSIENQNSLHLRLARGLQWLISGTYFLILFTAAVLYIFRGNRSTSLNVMRLLPRLLLSIGLTVISGFLIGAAISFSNLLVISMFGIDDVWTIGGVNAILLNAGSISGAPGDLLQLMILIMVTGFVSIFYTMFVVASLARQVILIGLVVLAPIAFFCLIVPKWQARFGLWLRTLLAVCFIPVLLAFVFKIGMSVNPLVLDPEGAYGDLEGLIGLFLLLVTLWAMVRVIKMGQGYVTGGGASLTGKGLRGAGGLLGMAGQAAAMSGAASWAAPLLGGAGKGLGAAGRVSGALDGAQASMVPKGTGMLGSGQGVRGALGPGAAAAGAAGAGVAGGVNDKISNFMTNRGLKSQMNRGESMMGEQQVSAYEALKRQVDSQKQYEGLSRSDRDAIVDQHAQDLFGGQVSERGGQYYIRKPDSMIVDQQAQAQRKSLGQHLPSNAAPQSPKPNPAQRAAQSQADTHDAVAAEYGAGSATRAASNVEQNSPTERDATDVRKARRKRNNDPPEFYAG